MYMCIYIQRLRLLNSVDRTEPTSLMRKDRIDTTVYIILLHRQYAAIGTSIINVIQKIIVLVHKHFGGSTFRG